MYADFANVFIFLAFGAFFVVLNVSILSRLLRPTVKDAQKETTYECGEPPVGSGWVRFDIRFYTVALVFLIFDVEVAFLYPWAILFKDAKHDDQVVRCEIPVAGLIDAKQEMIQQLADKLEGARLVEKKPGTNVLEIAMDRSKPLTQTALEQALQVTGLKADVPASIVENRIKIMTGLGEPEAVTAGLQELGVHASSRTEEGKLAWTLTPDDPVRLADIETVFKNGNLAPTEVEWVGGAPWRFPLFLFLEMLVFMGILVVGFIYIWVKGDLSWIKTTDLRTAQAADAARARELAAGEVWRG